MTSLFSLSFVSVELSNSQFMKFNVSMDNISFVLDYIAIFEKKGIFFNILNKCFNILIVPFCLSPSFLGEFA